MKQTSKYSLFFVTLWKQTGRNLFLVAIQEDVIENLGLKNKGLENSEK